MRLSYRTRKLLLRIGIGLLVLLAVLILVFLGNLLWIDKHVYYTREGAKMDLTMPPISDQGQLAEPPKKQDPVKVYYYEESEQTVTSTELTQLVGYYIDAEQLKDIDAVKAQLQALPEKTPVMIEVKSIYGGFYYSSAITTTRSDQIDTGAMDELVAYLNDSGVYTIAVMPALREKEYGLAYDEDGVFHSSRGYLWMDDQGCYWLNPGRDGTLNHVTRAINELKGMGFNEVVLDDFCFPQTDNIYIGGDKDELIATAAQTLVTTCGSDSFAVSFVGGADFPLPEGRSRLYVKSAAAAEAAEIAKELQFEDDTAIRLVFLTENHDTRFEQYSVLRPLSSAH